MNPFIDSKKYFKSPLQEFMFFDKYSRFNYKLGRRETWIETVDRAVDFLKELSDYKLLDKDYQRIKEFILEMKAMPSMRLLAMAGEAARRNHISLYNCAFLGINDIRAFAEALYISISGCGVGFSVEHKHIDKLPLLPKTLKYVDETYIIEDTSEGWYWAIFNHIHNLYNGKIIDFDYSNLRPAGSVLKTKGGRASGPQALQDTIWIITSIFSTAIRNKQGKLKPIQVHDIMCSIGQCAISGGVRRTAMISIFDFDDKEMRYSKIGKFPNIRYNANNSNVIPVNGITQEEFDEMMNVILDGGYGEPGIFNLQAIKNTTVERRDYIKIQGVNPCGEIMLQDMQFCNLSSVVCRENDTMDSLGQKEAVAAAIGTIQSMATKFPLLRPEWKLNCEEERLLGVSLNGQMDCPILLNDNSNLLKEYLKATAIATNKMFATKLGIKHSASVTCVKPEGNSSQLLNCSSGAHPRYAKYYIRRVRVDVKSPIYEILFSAGVPLVPENGQDWHNITTAVASFPIKSPERAVVRDDLTAIEFLEYWKRLKLFYTEHNPSITIYVKDEEKEEVKRWIWQNLGIINGMTLLPFSDHKYQNAPYEEISEEKYEELIQNFPSIDWSLLEDLEKEDMTTASQELACMGGQCSV